jgi:uncharacterized protein (DUF697 family)/GTP-binding protein EngB required for normal cell division
MAIKLNKPILLLGISLSFLLWLWDSFQEQFRAVGEWSLLGIIALGSGFWFFYRQPSSIKLVPISPLKRETVEKVITEAQQQIIDLETEAPEKDISQLKQQIRQLSQAFARKSLQIAITGEKKVGKSSLKQILNKVKIAEDINIVETEALFTKNTIIEENEQNIVLASDLVLFIITGDLTESQWQLLQYYQQNHQRVILLFNKQDQYIPEERQIILQQLKQRVQTLISPEDIIPISTVPNAIKVRQHQANGTLQEWMETPKENLSNLENRLNKILTQEAEQLIWGTIWRDAQKLKQAGKNILNEVRRKRALPLIEKYQWLSAAAAFANPVSALDLLATAAINSQMVIDLSAIYQQKFSLSQAQTVSVIMGKLIVKLGLVELSTQAISSLLKSNAITYLAGGAVQGISAAYLTRLAGLSLIEYFQEQEVSIQSETGLNIERLTQKLTKVFQENQRTVLLKEFVSQAIKSIQNSKLKPEYKANYI